MTDPLADPFAGLKREHTAECLEAWTDYPAPHANRPDFCGAESANARVDAVAEKVRAMVADLQRERDDLRRMLDANVRQLVSFERQITNRDATIAHLTGIVRGQLAGEERAAKDARQWIVKPDVARIVEEERDRDATIARLGEALKEANGYVGKLAATCSAISDRACTCFLQPPPEEACVYCRARASFAATNRLLSDPSVIRAVEAAKETP